MSYTLKVNKFDMKPMHYKYDIKNKNLPIKFPMIESVKPLMST